MLEVNQDVVTGFQEFEMLPSEQQIAPKYATPACLSEAMQALWTNRVPDHEPWPRVIKVDETINQKTDEYLKNVRHTDQYDNQSSPEGLQSIGRVEGDEDISRNEFWRR